MPIYEYTCMKCNKGFSVLQRVGTTEKDTLCPECGSSDVKKKLSAFSCAPGASLSPSTSIPRFTGGG